MVELTHLKTMLLKHGFIFPKIIFGEENSTKNLWVVATPSQIFYHAIPHHQWKHPCEVGWIYLPLVNFECFLPRSAHSQCFLLNFVFHHAQKYQPFLVGANHPAPYCDHLLVIELRKWSSVAHLLMTKRSPDFFWLLKHICNFLHLQLFANKENLQNLIAIDHPKTSTFCMAIWTFPNAPEKPRKNIRISKTQHSKKSSTGPTEYQPLNLSIDCSSIATY